MRAVVQRVLSAAVAIAGQPHAAIGRGMLILLGVEAGDTAEDIAWLAGKLSRLRIFVDAQGRMNRNLAQSAGEFMVISQFTLLADVRSGNRPSFMRAEQPERARALYDQCVARLALACGRPPATGVFAADMQVSLVNDGPVTILLDSRSPGM
jgi:D-tyrosyl-tRNA(Tyr) deacylase